MILMWHHISNDLVYLTQLSQKIWCFYHKVNNFIKICCLAALLQRTKQWLLYFWHLYSALTALKKCYPIMIDKLPSNHFTTLLRLQDLATLPEKIVENIVHLPSAEVGNKMIVDYLVGLVHTEDHVILFCVLAERMLGEFDNCICILNLRNSKTFSSYMHINSCKVHIKLYVCTYLFSSTDVLQIEH